MHAVTCSLVMPASAAIPTFQDVPPGWRRRTARRFPSRGARDLQLLVGIVSMALGLAIVTVSLLPSAHALRESAPEPQRIILAGGAAPQPWADAAGQNRADPLTMSKSLARAPAVTAGSAVSATGPWASPLYPQNGVTLWDRIRVSTKKDRRAYLLGSAIQLHTPATAAVLCPWTTLPPCSRDREERRAAPLFKVPARFR